MTTHPPQYPCLENPMDRGAWRATVHGVTKGWTRLRQHAHTAPMRLHHNNDVCI